MTVDKLVDHGQDRKAGLGLFFFFKRALLLMHVRSFVGKTKLNSVQYQPCMYLRLVVLGWVCR